ncbi:MAG TPA: hypothetical protein EYO58_11695, partial [Flavobacteriales bacterium]|nr:hypothetical protein [Flavobacteriales bacterium]
MDAISLALSANSVAIYLTKEARGDQYYCYSQKLKNGKLKTILRAESGVLGLFRNVKKNIFIDNAKGGLGDFIYDEIPMGIQCLALLPFLDESAQCSGFLFVDRRERSCFSDIERRWLERIVIYLTELYRLKETSNQLARDLEKKERLHQACRRIGLAQSIEQVAHELQESVLEAV